MEMQNRDVMPWVLRIVCTVRPSVSSVRRGVPRQLEYLNNPFPYRLTLECLFHWHAFNMRSLSAMQSADHVL